MYICLRPNHVPAKLILQTMLILYLNDDEIDDDDQNWFRQGNLNEAIFASAQKLQGL